MVLGYQPVVARVSLWPRCSVALCAARTLRSPAERRVLAVVAASCFCQETAFLPWRQCQKRPTHSHYLAFVAAYSRSTRIIRGFFGRIVSKNFSLRRVAGSSSRRACCVRAASASGPSIIASPRPMQLRGPLPKGR